MEVEEGLISETCPAAEEAFDEVNPPPPQPQSGRRVNNVWQNVMEQERMEEMMGKLGGMDMMVESENSYRIERGPESYFIDKSLLPPRKAFSRKRKSGGPDEDDELDSDDSGASGSSMSSGGLSEPSKAYLFDQGCRIHPVHQFDCDFARIGSVVRLIGISASYMIYQKVLKIEKNGGLMIKNGARRRTPGGVFFYLIQRHPKTASEAVKKLFNTKTLRPVRKDGF